MKTPALKNRCRCGARLKKQMSPMKYRSVNEAKGYFCGELVCATYWQCNRCKKCYLDTKQFVGDFLASTLSGEFEFCLGHRRPRLERRGLKKLLIAHWLKS